MVRADTVVRPYERGVGHCVADVGAIPLWLPWLGIDHAELPSGGFEGDVEAGADDEHFQTELLPFVTN